MKTTPKATGLVIQMARTPVEIKTKLSALKSKEKAVYNG